MSDPQVSATAGTPADSADYVDPSNVAEVYAEMNPHGPVSPFSCPADFGRLLGLEGHNNYQDMRLHNCDLASGHDGDHHCVCGATGMEDVTNG